MKLEFRRPKWFAPGFPAAAKPQDREVIKLYTKNKKMGKVGAKNKSKKGKSSSSSSSSSSDDLVIKGPDDFDVLKPTGDDYQQKELDTQPQFGATASSQNEMSSIIPIQQYSFQFLPSMTDFNKNPIDKEAIERDFLEGTQKLVDSSLQLDEQLNRFFLEKCIFAYNADIVGEDQIRVFVADCWKVKFLFY